MPPSGIGDRPLSLLLCPSRLEMNIGMPMPPSLWIMHLHVGVHLRALGLVGFAARGHQQLVELLVLPAPPRSTAHRT